MTYTTKQGDTWSGVSFNLFGEERFLVDLLEANSKNMNTVIFGAGIILNVPEISVEQSETLPPWKRDDGT